jgi:predicted anti-sigma-YlaC factor YlaD
MERGLGGGHRRARELAATGIDFELGRDAWHTLHDHLSGCDACRRWAVGLQADAIALVELAFASQPAGRPVNGSGGGYNPAR